jgi:hypothetical protein
MSSPARRESRRRFLRSAAGTVALALTPRLLAEAAAPAAARPRPRIGIQCGALSFRDEGVEPVLDILQERGAVDTIFLESYAHGTRPGKIEPVKADPGHGRPDLEAAFAGGMFTAPHPDFYHGLALAEAAALRFGGYDAFAAVVPAARRRGLRVQATIEDSFFKDVEGFAELREVDWQGRPRPTFCALHPEYRGYVLARVTELAASYELDGLMWISEQQGPLHNAIGASYGGGDPGRVGCFCARHRQAARDRGIDPARAVDGFARLARFVTAARAGERPTDGYFVEFWRILLEYPELLAWETLWTDGKHGLYREIHRAAKQRRPALEAGFHLWHVNSFSPFFRAEQDYAALARHADYLKIVAYNNSGGPRDVGYLDQVGATIFRDLPKEELTALHDHWLGYTGEAPYGERAVAGLSARYVASETRRAVAGVKGGCRIYTGIDVDIPTAPGQKQTTPEDVHAATAAALAAGADGIIFCRNYAEMRLDNLAGGGRAVRDFLKRSL